MSYSDMRGAISASRCNDSVITRLLGLVVVLLMASAGNSYANGSISFQNFADDPVAGIDYERTNSLFFSTYDAFRQDSLTNPKTLGDFVFDTPYRPYGQPGVAIFDYDGDGDLDIYATNGPGTANSLLENQLQETGQMSFIDVGAVSGADATGQDSRGVCAGDIDNDGDKDLLVLGADQPNILFENLGIGQFVEVPLSGLEGGDLSHPSCAMGDIDNDGLLDVLVANAFDHNDFFACVIEPFAANQHNQLYLNQGNNNFIDISATSGIENLTGLGPNNGSAGITWAVGMIDIDRDGDLDLLFGDDQCAFVKAKYGGTDRGFIHVMINDGTANFTDHPITNSPVASGSWMGFGFGDFNCDGNVDIFGSNFGDYHLSTEGFPYELGDESSRWLLGNGDGSFSDPGVGAGIASVFGWGNAVYDYDNDGDQDIAYFGSLHTNFYATADNPGTMLLNQGCTANFSPDIDLFRREYTRHKVHGVAGGDLDGNGFADLVTVSAYDVPADVVLALGEESYDAIWDDIAYFVPTFVADPGGSEGLVWSGIDFDNGTLTVELNSGNTNKYVGVRVMGTIGLTENGRVNRDGIGAIVSFTPHHGETVLTPVHGGSSFASQHDLEALFGLGSAYLGTVDVEWPGGVRNRLYAAHHGERIVFPEIPCSFDDNWSSLYAYVSCVDTSLHALVLEGSLSHAERVRFKLSALVAYILEQF